MKKLSKTKTELFCNSCESDFQIFYWEESVAGEIKSCPFCKADFMEDDFSKEDDLDEVFEDDESNE